MPGFWRSFKPIGKRLRRYPIEIGLVGIAFMITIISAFVFIISQQSSDANTDILSTIRINQSNRPVNHNIMMVDIGGAVVNPGVYPVSQSARLQDVLHLAHGLSDNADQDYFSRNYNLARFVSDQEKIYIPSFEEVSRGLFIENIRTLDFTGPLTMVGTEINASDQSLIDINLAGVDELDTLPGIGKITAENIIKNRPYQNIDELVTKKVVKKNVYEAIKALITVN